MDSDLVSSDEIDKLPYLDAVSAWLSSFLRCLVHLLTDPPPKVIRETLRLYSPVPNTIRVSQKDDVVPLSHPVKGRDGKEITEVLLPKGTVVFIPITSLNRSELVWGKDAKEYK